MKEHKVSLDDKYRLHEGRVFLTGTQALARLPMLQQEMDKANGLHTAGFISGYRGSPLGGLDKTLWQAKSFLKEHNIHFQPGVNEDLAATAVWGSQQVNLFEGARYDGVFAMWYGKGPGVDRSGDVFKHANHAGTSRHGGVLVIAGDDHGCKSSTLPHQTEYAFVDAMIPVLNPSGVQEIIDYGLLGWSLSRACGLWVCLKTIAETVDASYSTDIDVSRLDIVMPQAPDLSIRWPDKPLEQEERLHDHKLETALAFARANHLNRVTIDSPNPRLGIISTGKSYLDVLQALRDLGIDESLAAEMGIRLYKVGMTWPLEPAGIREFAEGLDEVLVVEEKRGLIEEQLTSQLYNWHTDVRPVVVGKHDETGKWLLPAKGELTPAVIGRAIAGRVSRFFTSHTMEDRLAFLAKKEAYLHRDKEIVERTPHFCSGCPHNTSTVVPEGSRAMGGIGCHYMATWMERSTDTFSQMGGEGAAWIGQAPFTDTPHVFQNLGDGTYFHSGLLAIRAALAAGASITYKILYNDAVAMTGGQPVDGQLTVSQMAQQLAGEGVRRLSVVSDDIHKYDRSEFPAMTTFDHRDDLDAVQRSLREYSGTSVMIYDQTCAAEKRRRRKRGLMPDPKVRPFINTSVCEGCGDCGAVSNCLSITPVETDLGRKRRIDQSSCNKDMSCIKGFCPSFVSVVGGDRRKPEPAAFAEQELPLPALPDLAEPYGIVIAGVGGTGVTTLGAILGWAAHIDTKGASVLDMTGLAQKFGAVITHVQVANAAEDIYASRIAAGGARLVIGADLVVAASNDAMVKVARGQASAVINSFEAMTAEFTRDADAEFPGDSMRNLIRECVGSERTRFVDATGISESWLGDTLGANLFLAGHAFQQGLIPISLDAIIEAIELNGAGVEMNKRAFELGRRAAIGMLALEAAGGVEDLPADAESVIQRRRAFLVDYQDEKLADRYESRTEHLPNDELTLAIAENWFKLLAYKDEYEVARLYSDPAFRQNVAEEFEGDYRLQFHLAPPLLAPTDPNTGLPRKITLGGWVDPVFRLLSKFRFLRGTRLDPFGYTEDRKLERTLIEAYPGVIERALTHLDEKTLSTITEIAALPAMVRGYGHVKARNAAAMQTEQDRLFRKLEVEPDPVKVFDPQIAA